MKKILMITLVGFFLIVGLYVGATFISEQPLINIFGGDAPNTFGFSEQVDWGGGELLTGLTAYYKLDNSSGVIYDMTRNYDGVNSGASRGQAGIINDGVYFNSSQSDYLHSFGMPIDPLELNFTVSVWLNSTDLTGVHRAVSSLTAITGNSRFNIYTTGNKLGMLQNRDYAISLTGTTVLPLNTWYHVVLVSNDTGITGYLNGVEEIGGTATGDIFYIANQGIHMGAMYFNGALDGDRWDGNIDEVGFWNRSLTEDEIVLLYNSGVGNSYPFSSGGGTITLNSPADDSISASPDVIFNATANITSGGALITNMSLFTNETGTWAVRNISNMSSFGKVNVQASPSWSSNGVQTGYSGIKISIGNANIQLYSVEKYTSVSATEAYIGTSIQGNEVGTGTFIGNEATFSSPLTLLANTNYSITVGSNGVPFNDYYDSGFAYTNPSEEEFVWAGRIDQVGNNPSVSVSDIVSINFSSSLPCIDVPI